MSQPTREDAKDKPRRKPAREIDSITIRFSGDSGDGIQMTGSQFTTTTAVAGNDLSTFPDYPSEIRAPAGTVPGVSGFQIHFSSSEVLTPGDAPQVLVAFNPAALKANLKDLERGGTILLNTDAFTPQALTKAGLSSNPLEDGSLSSYRVIPIAMTSLTDKALQGLGMTPAQIGRCKNFYALGVMYWLFERPLEPTMAWLKRKFAKLPTVMEANTRALAAGHAYAETTEIFEHTYRVKKAPIAPGLYRNITGNEACALALVAASRRAGIPLFYGSYPITPATEILQFLSRYKAHRVVTFQAEDEIAAVGSSLGAAFAGNLAATGTSGPGLALKTEFLGLAVITELPLVVIDVQRGGPSTGLPTKTEQSDLLQAVYGRNGDCPLIVLAPATPAECFSMTVEACRLAVKYMTPVLLLSDGYLANGSEPWRIPPLKELPEIPVLHPKDPKTFAPYARDPKTLARPWAVPGTPGLAHRIGGLEKLDGGGSVSYDPENHAKMTRLRAEKIERAAADIPPLKVLGRPEGEVLVIGWGSTYGPVTTAVKALQAEGEKVSAVHLRHLNPLPKDLADILPRFKKVLVPELNLGQLRTVLQSRYMRPVESLAKVKGQPFKVAEVREGILGLLRRKG